MHMNIIAIVYAETAEDAAERAESVFEDLVNNGSGFDYYDIMREPVPAECVLGIKLIVEGMRATKRDFLDAVRRIREVLEKKTDEELWECRYDPEMFRHHCHRVGAYDGPSVYVYDNDGSGITDPGHLESVLNKYASIYEDRGKESPCSDDRVWVVEADVHF
jgi:hypothetical protein